ncbi:MAG: hypothetical protein IJ068_02175 [Bacilli bacterium]|nr:hypothetical protein [Bacilli bacterium]
MNLLKAIWTTINFFVYFIGLFGMIFSNIYAIWYFAVIFLGVLFYISFKYKSKFVILFSIGIAVSNYISYYFINNAPGVDGGFGGLEENVRYTIISGWFNFLTLILIVLLIVSVNKSKNKW